MIARALLVAAVLVPVLIALAASMAVDARLQRFLLFYLVPPAMAVLLWARLRLLEYASSTRIRTLMDTLVVVLAAMRFVSAFVPISGHMLFFTYSALTTRNRGYQTLAIFFWLETTVFKLWIWNDALTWALGILCGCVAAIIVSKAFMFNGRRLGFPS